MQQSDVAQAKRVLKVQVVLTLILPVAALIISQPVALSVLIGGAICTTANAVFAFWVFRQYRAQQPGLLVMRFYGAELIKLVLILALFVAAFALLEGLNIPALLGAYFIIQVLPALMAT